MIGAAVDIGSNAVRITVARRGKNGRLKELASERVALRLGHDVFTRGRLSRESTTVLTAALKRFKTLALRCRVQKMRAVATSAMREAANGFSVARHVSKTFPVPVEIISGTEEAGLLRLAVSRALKLEGTGPCLLFELGGGSAEVSLLLRGRFRFSQSYRVGAVRLLEILKDGPRGPEHCRALIERSCAVIKEHLKRAGLGMSASVRLVGTGGNLEALADLSRGNKKRRRLEKVKLGRLRKTVEKIRDFSPLGRVRRLGLRPDRADVIEPAAAMCLRLMDAVRAKELWVPYATLRQGVLEKLI
jgi:exopolyphosphatase/guanosine-5'-triphosphate,3'-diphosphate pyrophosphatase